MIKIAKSFLFGGKIRLLVLVLASLAITEPHGRAQTWDTSMCTGSIPSGPFWNITTVNETNLYVICANGEGTGVFSYNAHDGWVALVDTHWTTMIPSSAIAATNNHVYIIGTGVTGGTGHSGLFAWNISTKTWAQLGSDLDEIGATAAVIGVDNYIYFCNPQNEMTLPNSESASCVFRYNLAVTNDTGWDNMLGGINMIAEGNSARAGVYTLEADHDTYTVSGTNYTRTIIYIGGQFSGPNDTNHFPFTNYDVIVFESSANIGQKYVAVQRGSSAYNGVVNCIAACGDPYPAWSDSFVTKIMAGQTSAGAKEVIFGGDFEDGLDNGGCSSTCLGYFGTAQIEKTVSGINNTYKTASWPSDGPLLSNYYLSGDPCSDLVDTNSQISTATIGGTNRYLFGNFSKWDGHSVCTGSTTGTGAFAQGTSNIEPAYMLQLTGFSLIYTWPNLIYAMSRTTDSCGEIYLVGDFDSIDGNTCANIIGFLPNCSAGPPP